MGIFSGKETRTRERLVEQVLLEQYERYFRLACSYVHSEADAADIVQNGAYKAILNSGALKKEEYVSTWVYRIMLNEIFRFYKAPVYESLEEITEVEGKEDVYEEFDLKEALNSLDVKDKAIVELRYFEDLKLEEIAEILQENVSTVKSRLYRSMKKLKLRLSD